MPRTFTRAELIRTITVADYWAMSPADQAAFDAAMVAMWKADTDAADHAYLAGDYDRVASNRRYEIGE